MPEQLGSSPGSESPTPLDKGDGETWEDYAHRLEHRVKEQRDHIKRLVELRDEPGDRAARKRIEWLERALGSMTLRWEKVTADFAGFRESASAWPYESEKEIVTIIGEALKCAYPYVMDALHEAEINSSGTAHIVREDLEQSIVPARALIDALTKRGPGAVATPEVPHD